MPHCTVYADEELWNETVEERSGTTAIPERLYTAARAKQSAAQKHATRSRYGRTASKPQACSGIHRRGTRRNAW